MTVSEGCRLSDYTFRDPDTVGLPVSFVSKPFFPTYSRGMSDRSPNSSTPKPNKFQLRREATHKELLRLGIERFPIKGYAATSISDIVENSGLTRGAFYFHFESKEEFFLAVLRERAARREGWWEAAAKSDVSSIEDAVVASLTALERVGEAGSFVWVPCMVEFAQAVRGNTDYQQELHEIYLEWVRELENWVNVLAERGLVRTDRSTTELAASIFAYGEGAEIHAALYRADIQQLMVDGVVRLLKP